ncbi:hypothetical protein [Phaeobacter gallaeciensis]|uniref:hypothetical protein n=1 Tax=Phaeobacter gallaeciensis TaxID=60890 RepID=UPI00237F35C4|nr:hypothetical protein [Phaeobacter gallaeciensis]MDE4139979.1 hypothetical protein [Phaeobacter gallaeciensis]MDE4148411.1 hypothetical protein [Phaeobacter gallaeciensis]MDE4152645.1 hypothetical protein [Phaeobacter gallaeciensis]MDE4228021.1 hypothetical protein [Phaeobacter gallaeciensis]MDE4257110.1 hypothetical protein [Phaeobacter gallaeciensis]
MSSLPASLFEVPLAFAEAPDWPSTKALPALRYDVQPYAPTKPGASVQPVLRDRLIARPRIDLNQYRCRAEIDWLELFLETPDRRQAVNLHRAIRRMLEELGSTSTVFVSGPDRKSGYKGTRFLLRFQQPNPQVLRRVLEKIVEKYVPEQTPDALFLMGIEVSVDFYATKSATRSETELDLLRWQMVDILRRHLRPEPVLTESERGWPRTYGGAYGGDGATFLLNPSAADLSASVVPLTAKYDLPASAFVPLDLKKHTQPAVDRTAYIGAREEVVSLRSMDKITDRRDPEAGTAVPLRLKDCRARLEVTLKGEPGEVGGHGALGMERVADLYGFDFQKELRKLVFEFFLPTFGAPCETASLGFPVKASEVEVFKRSGVYGLDRLHRAIHDINLCRHQQGVLADKPVTLRRKGRLVSWEEMNKKVNRALDRLSKDWAG